MWKSWPGCLVVLSLLLFPAGAIAEDESGAARTPHDWPLPASGSTSLYDVRMQVETVLEMPGRRGKARMHVEVDTRQRETFLRSGDGGDGTLQSRVGFTSGTMTLEVPGEETRRSHMEEEFERTGVHLEPGGQDALGLTTGARTELTWWAADGGTPHLCWSRYGLPKAPPKHEMAWRHRCWFCAVGPLRSEGWDAYSVLERPSDDEWILVTKARADAGAEFERTLHLRPSDGQVLRGACTISRVASGDEGNALMQIHLHAVLAPPAEGRDERRTVRAEIRRLGSSDPDQRLQAARTLGEATPWGGLAAPALVVALGDPEARVRDAAESALRTLGLSALDALAAEYDRRLAVADSPLGRSIHQLEMLYRDKPDIGEGLLDGVVLADIGTLQAALRPPPVDSPGLDVIDLLLAKNCTPDMEDGLWLSHPDLPRLSCLALAFRCLRHLPVAPVVRAGAALRRLRARDDQHAHWVAEELVHRVGRTRRPAQRGARPTPDVARIRQALQALGRSFGPGGPPPEDLPDLMIAAADHPELPALAADVERATKDLDHIRWRGRNIEKALLLRLRAASVDAPDAAMRALVDLFPTHDPGHADREDDYDLRREIRLEQPRNPFLYGPRGLIAIACDGLMRGWSNASAATRQHVRARLGPLAALWVTHNPPPALVGLWHVAHEKDVAEARVYVDLIRRTGGAWTDLFAQGPTNERLSPRRNFASRLYELEGRAARLYEMRLALLGSARTLESLPDEDKSEVERLIGAWLEDADPATRQAVLRALDALR